MYSNRKPIYSVIYYTYIIVFFVYIQKYFQKLGRKADYYFISTILKVHTKDKCAQWNIPDSLLSWYCYCLLIWSALEDN